MGITVTNKETPPDDDVCPVCFGEFVLPCRANCGHWFCGSCILQVWNFSSAFQACKCPMCGSHIKSLKPDASLHLQDEEEEEGRKVLKSIQRYNRLFVGGAWGFILKLYDVPLLLRRTFHEMTDPNQVHRHVHSWRILAIILGTLYMICPFKFIPEGIDVILLCNLATPVVVILIKVAGFFQRRRSAERVRRLAATETPMG